MTRNLCTICMRAGSKGVRNKNIRLLHGKPLMNYTIGHAQECGLFEHIVVSTDSEEIAKCARECGAEAWFLRPRELATDSAPKVPAIRHALQKAESYYGHEFDIVIDLDATSPLRTTDDIIAAYKQFVEEDASILLTCSPSRKNPYFNMVEIIGNNVKKVKELDRPVVRRQDAPEVFDLNASIYIWRRDVLLQLDKLYTDKTALFVMPEERSVDIDTDLDWEFVEFILGKKGHS